MNRDINIKSEHTYRPVIVYLFALAIICVIAYWPISFHVFSLKNDALNYFLPVRHLVSESFQHNIFPYWTPYLNLGYPLHGDMQSGVWNPVVQFLSLFGSYSLYTLQVETLIYVWLGGVGMFFLLKYLRVHPYANLLAATAYMLCGFNSDSAQFLNWIAGTAFLPFVFLFYYRSLVERSMWNGVYAATAMFFLFTCAYPADFILTGYLLLTLLFVTGIKTLKQKLALQLRHLVLVHVVMLFVFLLLAGPAILSYIESLPLQERGSGADYEQVMSNPLHPALLSTFTTPLGAWKMPGVEITDPLIRNSYIGIIPFLLAIASFLSRTPGFIIRFSKWAALVFLLFSLGEFGLIRIVTYYTLPLMDAFRHPANAKMFTIFFLCILSADSLSSIIRGELKLKISLHAWRIVLGILLLVLVISVFTPITFFDLSTLFETNGVSFASRMKAQLEKISFADIVIITTIVQLIFLWLAYRFLFKKKHYRLLTLISIVNCVLFTMLFQPFTVVKKSRAAYTQQVISANSVKGYPIPDMNTTLKENSEGNEDLMGEIGCRNLYNKKIGRSEYRITPCNLLTQNEFWFDTSLRKVIMNYPILYQAETILPVDKVASIDTHSKKIAFVQDASIPFMQPTAGAKITLDKFRPGYVSGEVTSTSGGLFVLAQNNYPRWQLFIDGKPASILPVNVTFMGFRMTEGTHRFEFIYKSTDLRIAFIVSLITLIAILLVSFGRFVRNGKISP